MSFLYLSTLRSLHWVFILHSRICFMSLKNHYDDNLHKYFTIKIFWKITFDFSNKFVFMCSRELRSLRKASIIFAISPCRELWSKTWFISIIFFSKQSLTWWFRWCTVFFPKGPWDARHRSIPELSIYSDSIVIFRSFLKMLRIKSHWPFFRKRS